MKLFQMLVFTAVMFSNIRWQWTPNGYLASLIGVAASFLATVVLIKAIEAARGLALYMAAGRVRR